MPPQETPSLYDWLGGVYTIATAVDDFIDRIMVDPRLHANPWVDEAHHRVSPPGSRHVHQNRPLDHLHWVACDPLLRIMQRVARGDVIPPAVGATPDHVPSEFSRP
jgi:hypothetical protein